eukprot:5313455-Pleurochrysis_carterae.AAC.3
MRKSLLCGVTAEVAEAAEALEAAAASEVAIEWTRACALPFTRAAPQLAARWPPCLSTACGSAAAEDAAPSKQRKRARLECGGDSRGTACEAQLRPSPTAQPP